MTTRCWSSDCPCDSCVPKSSLRGVHPERCSSFASVKRARSGGADTRTVLMTAYHIAQVNIGRVKAPLEDQVMSGFVARLDEINALADVSPGFVWRLQSSAGNATYLRPYSDDRILLNMSVWGSVLI